MSTTTIATAPLEQEAADALVASLPSVATLVAVKAAAPAVVPAEAATAVIATFVGARSADLALVLLDTSMLQDAAGAGTRITATDVLHPALERGAAVLGAGVLGDATEADVTALFADGDTALFELLAGTTTAGWFLIRIRTAPAAARDIAPIGDKLSRINNVEMALTVEIGHTRMSVRDVLSLEPGAVIELDRAVGAPADVLLNGRLIALGEIVVVDQDYAVRITRILDDAEATR
ncbi:flagellar motor switch protein FliN [Galbitalea soli]|uniref:Flagellar motor switch protein FliN n=1 Tax=Galbitalea soli TaxID=1268042 RepID=A0A7C9PN08_9MICO|nr:flagellar motor switch protein FliN [Galbitalea soli]NEM91186.1 flagellar motor switch protein FliN [Galbitalea soli]NYJ29875.1 flagellar motor switch protein FliN/FliY [Galbitalea soli]